MKNEKAIRELGMELQMPVTAIDRMIRKMDSGVLAGEVDYPISLKNGTELEETVRFSKTQNGDIYYLNNRTTVDTASQKEVFTFINKSHNYSHQEIELLLKGRSFEKELVSKAGEAYTAWVAKDPQKDVAKIYRKEYGYDIDAVVLSFKLPDLENAEKRREITERLRRGEVVEVTGENQQKYQMAADVRFKSADFWDESGKKLPKEKKWELSKGGQQNDDIVNSKNKDQRRVLGV